MTEKFKTSSLLAKIIVAIGLIILVFSASLALFTLGYWLITLILAKFFAYSLPFTFTYALGGWLIALILYCMILPSGFRFKME